MSYVKVNDIQMYYEKKGQGPHLVLMAVIKNCGHMIHREKPEEFNHLIKDFFSRL